MASQTGAKLADELSDRSLDVYRRAAAYAESRGIILADTKFEWGQLPDGSLILIDEVLDAGQLAVLAEGFVSARARIRRRSTSNSCAIGWRQSGWDKNSPPPQLPEDVVEKTRAKYVEAFEKLTGKKFCVGDDSPGFAALA